MRVIHTSTFVSLLAAFGLAATGCGTGGDLAGTAGGGQADGTSSTAVAAPTTLQSTTTTAEITTTTADPAGSDKARQFKVLINEVDELQPAVYTFFDQATGQRIDELAEAACAKFNPDQTVEELGLVAIELQPDLTDEEMDLLGLIEFAEALGVLGGFYCSENLPPDIGESAPDPSELGDITGYRETVPSFLTAGHEGGPFIESLSDQRLDTLQKTACAETSPDQTTTELGLNVLSSYSDDLTEAERSLIGLDAYAEVYGTLLGWFCLDQLPTDS